MTRSPYRTSSPAAASGFPARRLARVNAPRSSAPELVTPRSAYPGRPRSCTVVCSPARTTQDAARLRLGGRARRRRDAEHLPHRRKRTRLPGRMSAGVSRDGSHSTASVRPISCQPPGDCPRVDARVLAGQRHGQRGHRGARRGPPRHLQAVVLPDEVGEPGAKPQNAAVHSCPEWMPMTSARSSPVSSATASRSSPSYTVSSVTMESSRTTGSVWVQAARPGRQAACGLGRGCGHQHRPGAGHHVELPVARLVPQLAVHAEHLRPARGSSTRNARSPTGRIPRDAPVAGIA